MRETQSTIEVYLLIPYIEGIHYDGVSNCHNNNKKNYCMKRNLRICICVCQIMRALMGVAFSIGQGKIAHF